MRARELLFSLVPVTVVVLVAGIAGEVYLRAQHTDVRKQIEAKAKGKQMCTRASSDSRRIYEGIPNKCDHNAMGFRDVEHAFDKPVGVYRIAVIGDSVAMGQGVRPEEAFGRVLERSLRARGTNAEVITLATTGYSTSQELSLLELAYRYRPDMILWTYVLNDPADPVIDNANGELGVYFHEPTSFVLAYLRTLWVRATRNFNPDKCPSDWHLQMHCWYRDDIARHFSSIAASGRDRAVPIVVAVIPLLPQGAFATYEYLRIHDDLRAMAEQRGLRLLDALPAFAGLDAEEIRLPMAGPGYDPWHPNAHGHALLGQYLAGQLATVISPAAK